MDGHGIIQNLTLLVFTLVDFLTVSESIVDDDQVYERNDWKHQDNVKKRIRKEAAIKIYIDQRQKQQDAISDSISFHGFLLIFCSPSGRYPYF
jgi:hypothetical protein